MRRAPRTPQRSPRAPSAWFASGLVAAALVAGAPGCGSAGDPPTPDLPGAIRVPASRFPLDGPPVAEGDPDRPVTHVGRTVLPRCHRMVVAEILSKRPAGLGTEVVRVRERDVIWGDPATDPDPVTILCGAMGLAPEPGRTALFLLRLLPAGGFEALEVAPVDDPAGAVRLRTFRTYLAVEGVEEPSARRLALLTYLRSALRSDDAWVQSNAVREYAAFADAFPSGLESEDGAALSKAIPALRDPELQRLAQSALDRARPAVREPGPRTPRVPAAAADATAFVRRFDEATGDGAARRDAVIDAASTAGEASEPLVARALDDADPRVREAAVAAAGQVPLPALAARILPMLVKDAAPEVRRTCVLALGHLRAGAAVDTLAGLARSDPALSREAMFALGRIRDEAALARLRELGATDDANRRLADFLASEDFVRQERAMGARWANVGSENVK